MEGLRDLPIIVAISLLLVSTPAGALVASGLSVEPPDLTLNTLASEDVQHRLESGGLYWAGQRLSYDGSAVVPDVSNATVDERTFRLRTVTSDDRAGSLVREFVVDTDGEAVLDTSGLEGRYVILYEDQVVYVQNGTGYTSYPPDGTSVTVRTSRWEVARQTLSARWSDDHVGRQDTADLQVSSSRASYRLAVSAKGLEYDALASMFHASAYADGHDTRADEDVLILRAEGEIDYGVTFAELGSGEYTLVLEATDTDARTTATIRVGRVPSGEPAPSPTATPPPSPDVTPSPERTPTRGPATTAVPPPPTSTAGSPTPGTTPPPSTATVTETPGQPGLGIAVTIVALLAAALLAVRRRD